MPQERCSDCSLAITEVHVRRLTHDPEMGRFIAAHLDARVVCQRCDIDNIAKVPMSRLIHDWRIACDPLLPHKIEKDELSSPGPELEAVVDKIRLEYCPLQIGLRNSIPSM